MATRINQNIWGAPSIQISVDNGAPYNDYHKVSPHSYTDIMSSHSEYVNAPYDNSVTVWGVPSDSSAGAFTTFSWWYADNHIEAELIPPESNKNVPMTLLSDAYTTTEGLYWGTIDTFGSNYIKNRTKDDITVVTDSYNFDVDADTTITANHKIKTEDNNLAYPNAQITSYIYNKYILVPWVSLTGEVGQPTNYTYVWSNPYDNVYNTSWDNVKSTLNCTDNQVLCCGIGFNRWGVNGNTPNTRSLSYKSSFMPQPLTKFSLSQRAKTSYGIDDFKPCYTLQPMPFIGFGARVSQNLSPTQPTFITGSASNNAPTPTTYFGSSDYVPNGGYCDCILRISQKRQVFDDVEYHWGIGIKWLNYMLDFDGDTTNLNDWLGMRVVPFLKIDDTKGDTYKNAVFKAVLHELAFFGLPFAKSETAAQTAIWDNNCEDIYIPLFDENMITTGEYVTLKEAYSQQLPQTTWNDIFTADEIVNYDPDYQPPGPTPPDTDSGDLINRGLYTNHFSNPSYTVWALYSTSLSNNGLDAIISAINNLYINDPDGNEKWTLDFKGSNPSDYIVGLYAYPLAFTTSSSSYVFTLGAVEFNTINAKHYADDGYFTFGEIDLSYHSDDVTWYGDFRDYPPYSTAILYIPFCGTVEIDIAFFIGHKMTIDMYYDIYTGACSAAVYRDNITLYKVINGQIGVQLPLTSLRAGDYQNNIHALENALKQNEMRLATSALTLGISAGAAVATGGASLAVGAGIITGAAGIMNNINERSNLEYKIEHTQPQVAQTGASETQNGYRVGGKYPKLYIKHAALLPSYNADVYGKTVGYACCINNKVGDNRGLIICSNVDTTGITATADEIKAIKQALASGVII